MKTFLNISFLLIFCLWLIPLGQFIQQERQSQICGGQRAFCMCLVTTAKKAASDLMSMATNTSANGSQQEGTAAGGHYFDANVLLSSLLSAQPWQTPELFQLSSAAFLRKIEHIPKA